MKDRDVMGKIYSYVLRYDDGIAPNPYGGVCTLAICKPVIRRKAQVGDWVIGTAPLKFDFGCRLVYAMKVTQVLSLEDYDLLCRSQFTIKIPQLDSEDVIRHRGDCIYDYSNNKTDPIQRAGGHCDDDIKRDLRGINVLLSTHFYYFGKSAILLPTRLLKLPKKGRGHKIITDQYLIADFEDWIKAYDLNKLYGEPQSLKSSCGGCVHNYRNKTV